MEGSHLKWTRPGFADRKAEGQPEGPIWHHPAAQGQSGPKPQCPDLQPRASSTSWRCPLYWEAVGIWGLFVLFLIDLLQGMPSLSKRLSFVTSRRRLHKLGVSKVTQVDFLPREVVSYSKETQTPLATHQSEGKLCLLFTFHMISGEIARELHPSCWFHILP